MAADALNNLMKNRNAIRRIMAMDESGHMDNMIKSAVQSGRMTYGEDGATYNSSLGQPASYGNGDFMITDEMLQKSKLPKPILESFQKNPINMPKMPSSVLDNIEMETLQQMKNETMQMEPMRQIGSNNGPIDYSLLRTIINEAVQENVKKYMSALSKKLINEGVSTSTGNSGLVQAVKLGENFSFITENGDVYEATLKYKTNLNTHTEKKKANKKSN